jgi:hypothetical protein
VVLSEDNVPILQKLQSFQKWLPKHAGLVQSICARAGYSDDADIKSVEDKLQQILQATSAAAAAQTQAAAAAAQLTAGATAAISISAPSQLADGQQVQQQQQQQCSWRLASFSCNLPGVARILNALPAHSLAHLELGVDHMTTCSAEQLAAALTRLSSLQTLCVDDKLGRQKSADLVCGSYLSEEKQLTQLTCLSFSGYLNNVEPVEQLLRQPLPRLQKLLLLFGRPLTKQNLSHLTQLQEIASGASFP